MLTQWVSRVTTVHIMSKKGNQYSHAYEMTLRSASTKLYCKTFGYFFNFNNFCYGICRLGPDYWGSYGSLDTHIYIFHWCQMSYVISQNMKYLSVCHMTYPSYDIWDTQNMSIWVSTEPVGQQESSLQYETLLKIHFKMKN